MYRRQLGSAWVGLVAGAVVAVVLASSAQAASITDTNPDLSAGANEYWGGVNAGNPTDRDVYQSSSSSRFQIYSMDVNVLGPVGAKDLQIVIHTNYSPYSGGTSPSGTSFGSLFIGSSATIPFPAATGVTGGATASDTYVGDESRFDYVVNMPGSTPIIGGPDAGKAAPPTAVGAAGFRTAVGNTGFFSLNGTGSDVQTSFFPVDPSGYRQDQAVGYTGSLTPEVKDATFAFDEAAETLTFLIKNENGLLGNTVLFAWAMTCANDVIFGTVDLPSRVNPPVPLPAGFLLMGSVLFGAGGIAGWRRRRRAVQA